MRLRQQTACRRCEWLQGVRGRPAGVPRAGSARPPRALGAAPGRAYLAGTWISGDRCPAE